MKDETITERTRNRVDNEGLLSLFRSSSFIFHPLSLVVIGLSLLIVPLFILQKTTTKETDFLRARHKELFTLGAEYKSLKGRLDSLEQRKSLTRVNGVPQALDDISGSLGLQGKVKSVKATGSREVSGGTEESAEAQIEKITLNELVNLLYKIDEAPVMLSVKRIAVKKTFENPELLNVTISLSLFVKK
ncbi:MAG TPA: hypothetical protein VFG09_05705 [Thermodesulfovibrionales bacterium]|jgi:hypothetical protein|nr:hypothetical protein [Thermodesulfovibrionales bacterium]